MDKKIGDKFQKETKYDPNKSLETSINLLNRPKPYKKYPLAEKIKLNSPKEISILYKLLKERKSVRNFLDKNISLDQLSYILWAASGIRKEEFGYNFRTAPSAGALYPIETYVIINRVHDIKKGVYHYSIENHMLDEIKLGDFSKDISDAALGQSMCEDAAVVFVWSAIFNRMKWKYGQRAYRYIYLDCGHIAQNLALAATSINLGSCQIGALFDDKVNKIIEVDGKKESVIYLSVLGWPK